jgi:hypothetical protein
MFGFGWSPAVAPSLAAGENLELWSGHLSPTRRFAQNRVPEAARNRRVGTLTVDVSKAMAQFPQVTDVDESVGHTAEGDSHWSGTKPSLLVFPPYYFPADPTLHDWIVAVDGFACQPGSEDKLTTRWSIAMMGKLMRAKPQELRDPLFLGRVAPFIAKGLKKLSIDVQIGLRRFRLTRRTNSRGAFRGRIRLTATDLCRLLELEVPAGRTAGQFLSQLPLPITLRVSVHPELTPVKTCQATKIAWAGWSVISDIDDTIKDSQVSPLRQLLTNTFLREFRSVAGMAELYRDWASLGCQFHYVSSSPWQLLDPLQQLCQEEQFPAGTFHLRTFRLGTDLVRKMLLRQRGKAIVIQSLLATFPQRKFVLVGDSGERDPEIYCRAAKRFPDQVKAIYIRDVESRRITQRRLAKITESLPVGLCQAFSDARELSDLSKTLLLD